MKLHIFLKKHVHMDSAILLAACLFYGAAILFINDVAGFQLTLMGALN